MTQRTNVHDEFRSMCEMRDEDPSGHSDVVDRMFEKVESELAKLPIDQVIPYRHQPPPPETHQRRQTTRISASGESRVVLTPTEDEEEAEDIPPVHRFATKEEACRHMQHRTSKAEEVLHYREVIDQAMAIQYTALSRIAQLVKEMDE